MHIGQLSLTFHLAIEMIAMWAAFRLYLKLRKRDSLNLQKRIPILLGGILGAAIGSKLSYFLEDPLAVIAQIPHWANLLEGKALVGALIGGWVGIELTKKFQRVKSATGDACVR